jgi:peptide/nickel transport system permease protein
MRRLFVEGLKNKTFMLGLIMIVSVILVAVFADFIAPYGFDQQNLQSILKAPGENGFILGSDNLGRDLFSRNIYGARIALEVALIAVSVQLVIGVSVGLISGYYGGKIDRILSFVVDLTWSMPSLIMALVVITILGPSLNNVIVAIAIVSWAQFARIVRAKTQALKNLPYVETAIAFGERPAAIMIKYILPNIVPSIIVIATVSIPNVIMYTTSLGFLGLGAQPPSPDWGVALSESINYITIAPWLSIYPGIALVYTVLSFTLFGEGLRDILDPKLKL